MVKLRSQKILGLSCFLLLIVGCSSSGDLSKSNPFEPQRASSIIERAKAGADPVRILYVNNVQGEIGTCGCAMAPVGGVDRRLNFLMSFKNRGESFVHLDSGSFLFSALTLTGPTKGKAHRTAEAIAEAYGQLPLVALNVGRYDLVEGHEFYQALVRKFSLPAVSTNLVDRHGRHPFATHRELEIGGGRRIRVLGLSSVSRSVVPGLELRPEDPVAAVSRELEGVSPEILVIVLSDLSAVENETLLNSLERPVVLLGSTGFDAYSIPLHKGSTLMGQTIAQGQEIGELLLHWGRGDQRGWINESSLSSFSSRWGTLKAEKEFLNQQTDSEFLAQEKERNQEGFRALEAYAPYRNPRGVVYGAWLHTMDKKWAQKNKLSDLVRKTKAIP